MELTAEQQAVVDHDGGRLLVAGGPGTGKTTSLLARWRRLVDGHPASSVLVLCPSRAAAGRFLDAALPHLAGGFDGLPVTTVWGLAYDLVARHDEPPTLVTGAEQREDVARLLAAEGPSRWPSCAHFVGRRAFATEVAAAVLDVESSFLEPEEMLSRAAAAGDGERARWVDLLAFTARYRAALARRGLVDGAGLLVAASRVLAGNEAPAARFTHVLVDDAHLAPAATGPLVRRLADLGAQVTATADPDAVGPPEDAWAGLAGAASDTDAVGPPKDAWAGLAGAASDTAAVGRPTDAGAGRAASASDLDVVGPPPSPSGGLAGPAATAVSLTAAFGPPPDRALVTCSHPSVEAEAVAGELRAAHDEGVPWADMAVLVRTSGGARARAIGRALARHGVPTATGPPSTGDEPVQRAILDVLRWVGGDTGALDRLVASPVAGLDPAEVRAVRTDAARRGIPLESHPRLADLARLRADLVSRAATSTPADLAFEVWRQALGHLAAPGAGGDADDRSLDAVVALLDGLRRRADRRPRERLADLLACLADGDAGEDPWSWTGPGRGDAGGVTVSSIAGAAGRRWHTVVIAGCVEGELPRVRSRPRLFDRAVLTEAVPPRAVVRRRRALDDERRLFAAACARATSQLVAVAAPEPGVLLSRMVEGWPPAVVRLPLAPGPAPTTRRRTANEIPVFADGQLRLSASQLSTYDDCPLRYAYEYGLGAKGEAGVHAALGSLVHAVLAEFLDPGNDDAPHTREGLLALGERLWRDDIARYRPQVEEARRDCFAMLEAWWEAEGGDERLAPEVLATERRFDVEAAGHRVVGSIDRVDRADGGDGIRIVDYKTGKGEPRLDAVADDVQLAIYHLAASRDPQLMALGTPTQLRLLYVRSMHAFDQPVTDDHEAATEARIAATADRILAEDFEPSVDANCRLCSFHRLCPLQDEGRMTVEVSS